MFIKCLLVLSLAMLSRGQEGDFKKCSPGMIAVQNKKKVPESNACSKPPGFEIRGEEDFTYCCDRHDVCYETCNMNKDYCESEFEKCMKNLCRTNFKKNPECQQAAQMYTMGTSMFGGGAFAESQDQFCTCIEESQVDTHYAKLVHNFYIEHVPDRASEWEDYTSAGKIWKYLPHIGQNTAKDPFSKIAKVFYNMYSKYDTAIKHVGERTGKNPPVPKKKNEL